MLLKYDYSRWHGLMCRVEEQWYYIIFCTFLCWICCNFVLFWWFTIFVVVAGSAILLVHIEVYCFLCWNIYNHDCMGIGIVYYNFSCAYLCDWESYLNLCCFWNFCVNFCAYLFIFLCLFWCLLFCVYLCAYLCDYNFVLE